MAHAKEAPQASGHIKKDDFVKVIAGKDRGKQGKVLRVFPHEGRLTVERVNMIKRHTRSTRQMQQGGIIEREGKLHLSNVMLICRSEEHTSELQSLAYLVCRLLL